MTYFAELISVGSELLNGRTLNSHGRDLGAALYSIGLQLTRDTTIPDDIETIVSAAKEALNRTNLVFVSGGLGPTSDDITRDALVKLLNRKLVTHQPAIDFMVEWNRKRGRPMNEVGKRQALVLENAAVLPNPAGAAPGQRIGLPGNKTLFVLPGPPNEFNAILSESIIPWLKIEFPDAKPKIVRTVKTKGIPESEIVTLLEKEHFSPENIDLGFYPGGGRVEIRLTAESGFETEAETAANYLSKLFSEFIEKE